MLLIPDKFVEVLIQCMDWNILSCQSSIPKAELPELQQKAINLLDLLQKTSLIRPGKWPSGILKGT
jgi:hypothetical protein